MSFHICIRNNILFIIGGAFDGIEKIIKQRTGKKNLGFGSEHTTAKDDDEHILEKLDGEDLLKFGLIPEFIGRIPIFATLKPLDEEALISILTQPKNALIKQYKQLLNLEDVTLTFDDEALKAIAQEALARKTGARGLRSVLEKAMLDIMYDIPSNSSIKEVIINKEVITEHKQPIIVMQKEAMAS